MIVSHGKFVIRPEQLERAKEVMSEMMEHTLKEPGCISYDFFSSISKPHVMMLFQEWESMEDIQAHFETEHMDRFLKVLPELLQTEVITHRYAIHDPDEIRDIHDADATGEIEFEFEEEPITLH